ncbi:lipopolysaccharide transport system permease protein [Marinimicrobium koreense]|uniref:Lipopolysaccharide transport system permease protein n=1 Tax=Marinimicrobium koreense TaxID=306545 RepID=A0A3N1NJS7_9GAMM|nr:ABC transporter permease [Marinimicrobium koreense]ROQ20064.1 lipopolysaccharide transport system permease protein [Marinimicrobium koreense]
MNPLQFISLLDLKARMALKSEASKLYLSYLWWVLEPMLWVMAFYFVFTILLEMGRDIAFLMCGKIPFLWFSKSVTTGSNSIVASKGLINQVNIPKAFFPYQSLQEALYKQWLVFLVLFALLIFYGYNASWHWLWVLPVIVANYLLILLCTLVGAFLVSYVRDIRMLINMGVLFLMFASGIFWDVNDIADPAKREALLTWNPVAFILDAYRAVLMRGEMFDHQHMIVLSAIMLGGVVLMHLVYRLFSQSIASKVINS